MKKFIISIAILVGLSVSAQAGWITSTSVDEMENKKTVYMKVTSEDKFAMPYVRRGKQVCRFVRTKGLYVAQMTRRNPAFKRPTPCTRPAAKYVIPRP